MVDAAKAQSGAFVWSAPYLETCCRASLHRLCLAGRRPPLTKDEACLRRLVGLGLARREGADYAATDAGRLRHASEILSPPNPLARG